MDVEATSPEVAVEVEDITSLEVVVEEEAVEAMEGLEVPVETLAVEEVSSVRDKGETTATTGEATLREDLVEREDLEEECPRVRGSVREEAMLLLSEVGVGGKIKVSKKWSKIDFIYLY